MKQALKDPILILLLVAGVFLIFANLGNIYLWQDEAETAVLAKNVLKFGFPRAFDGKNLVDHSLEYRTNYAWVYHPWLQFYLTAASFALLGSTTFAARLPFAIFGFGAILLTYLLAKRLTNNKTVARLATLLLVFSVPFLLHVRQCRWFALTIFFTPLVLLAYLDFIENRKHGAIKFIFSCILLFHSNHGLFIAVFGALFIHYILFYLRGRRLRQILPILFTIALFTLPWLFYSIAWQHFTFLYTKGWQRELFELDHLRQNFEFYFRVINKYIVPVAFFSIIALFRLIKNKINPFSSKALKKSSIWLVLLVIFASIFLLLFVDQRQLRYITNLIPLLLILAAIVLTDWMKSSKLLTGIVIVGIIFSNFFNNPKIKFHLFNYFYEITHDYNGPNEGIVKYLAANAQSGQTVKTPYGNRVLIFYTDLIIENPVAFTKEETYPDWIILRKDWIEPAFFKSDYFNQIQKRYKKIVLDYPDIMWGNRPEPGYHKYRTQTNYPGVISYKKIDYR